MSVKEAASKWESSSPRADAPAGRNVPPLSRTRSQVMAQTALETIRAQKGQLVSSGLSRASFFVGVSNALLTAFLIGRYPQHYWLLHTIKSAAMLPVRTVSAFRKNQGLWMVEFCWVANYAVLAASLYLLTALLVPSVNLASDATMRTGWYLFYMVAVGPLGAAVAATGNALVFHSFDNTASLFIHSSPLLAAWCIHTDMTRFRGAYPALLLGIEGDSPDAVSLFLPALSFYLCWWVPYSIWLLTDGVDQPARGNATVYAPLAPAVVKVFPWTRGRPRLAAAHYLVGHLLGTVRGPNSNRCRYRLPCELEQDAAAPDSSFERFAWMGAGGSEKIAPGPACRRQPASAQRSSHSTRRRSSPATLSASFCARCGRGRRVTTITSWMSTRRKWPPLWTRGVPARSSSRVKNKSITEEQVHHWTGGWRRGFRVCTHDAVHCADLTTATEMKA